MRNGKRLDLDCTFADGARENLDSAENESSSIFKFPALPFIRD